MNSLSISETYDQDKDYQCIIKGEVAMPIKNLYMSSAWAFTAEGQATVILRGYRLGRQLVWKKQRRIKVILV
jgi:hypothetical protein